MKASETVKLCEHKFPIIPYFDLPPQISVTKILALYRGSPLYVDVTCVGE
jgi:hypothetical protein